MRIKKKSIFVSISLLIVCVYLVSLFFSWKKNESMLRMERLLTGSHVDNCKELREKFPFSEVKQVFGDSISSERVNGYIKYSYPSDVGVDQRIFFYVNPDNAIVERVQCDTKYFKDL